MGDSTCAWKTKAIGVANGLDALGFSGSRKEAFAEMQKATGGAGRRVSSGPSPVSSSIFPESPCTHAPAIVEAGRASLLFIINSTNIDYLPLTGPELCWKLRDGGNKRGSQTALSGALGASSLN